MLITTMKDVRASILEGFHFISDNTSYQECSDLGDNDTFMTKIIIRHILSFHMTSPMKIGCQGRFK